MTLGYDRPLYFLPFDHRGSFKTGMCGWKGAITQEQTAQIAATKQLMYDGFKIAIAAGVQKQKAGILRLIEQINSGCDLEVDDGIDAETAPLAVAAGANVLVAGTAILVRARKWLRRWTDCEPASSS
jgi:3-keto-L-gulonate-6-phosphate decarboxylase